MREIIAQPGFVPQDLRDLLASREFIYADLFTISTKFGDKLRYTTSEEDAVLFPLDIVDPHIKEAWTSRQLKVKGLALKIGTGVEVDEQEATIEYTAKMTYQGSGMSDAFRLGYFDGSTIRRDRVYAKDWGIRGDTVWVAGVQMFTGKLTNISSISRGNAKVTVKSDLLLLNIQMPKNLFQPSCVHTLFDPGCTLNRDDFKQDGLTETGSTRSKIVWSGTTEELTLGRIDIEDGSGVLTIRTIRKVDGNDMYLAYPLDFDPNLGMLFRVYPGCKRTLERCQEFDNEIHFKGFPFVPTPETAM